MQSEQIDQLATALAKAQGEMESAVMDKVNPHFSSHYASLSAVIEASRKPLSTNGLAITQTMDITEHGLVLRTTLMHSSGQWKDGVYPLPQTTKSHEMGSALTYARRYSHSAMVCNASDEDDDGNLAMTASSAGTKQYKLDPTVTEPKLEGSADNILKGKFTGYKSDGKFHSGRIGKTYLWTSDDSIGEQMAAVNEQFVDLTVGPEKPTKTGRGYSRRVLAVYSVPKYDDDLLGTSTDPEDDIPE